MVDAPEEEMKSEEGGHGLNKQVTRGWSYAGKLALVQKGDVDMRGPGYGRRKSVGWIGSTHLPSLAALFGA